MRLRRRQTGTMMTTYDDNDNDNENVEIDNATAKKCIR